MLSIFFLIGWTVFGSWMLISNVTHEDDTTDGYCTDYYHGPWLDGLALVFLVVSIIGIISISCYYLCAESKRDFGDLEFETILSDIYFQIENPNLDLESFFSQYENQLEDKKLFEYELAILRREFHMDLLTQFVAGNCEFCKMPISENSKSHVIR